MEVAQILMSLITFQKFAVVIFGITQKLLYITRHGISEI